MHGALGKAGFKILMPENSIGCVIFGVFTLGMSFTY